MQIFRIRSLFSKIGLVFVNYIQKVVIYVKYLQKSFNGESALGCEFVNFFDMIIVYRSRLSFRESFIITCNTFHVFRNAFVFIIFKPGIRTNTTICLGRIAQHLSTAVSFYLVNLFTRFCHSSSFSIVYSLKTFENRRYPASICLLKVNNRNTRTRCETCSELTVKTPEIYSTITHEKKSFKSRQKRT